MLPQESFFVCFEHNRSAATGKGPLDDPNTTYFRDVLGFTERQIAAELITIRAYFNTFGQVIGDLRTRKSGCTFCEHFCSSILYCLSSYPIDSSELLRHPSQLTRILTTMDSAHNSRKCSQRSTMLTTYENAQNAPQSCVHFAFTHLSVHMTQRFVIQGCPTLKPILAVSL